jgi:ABC-type Mn2+/Zn2+ transport system permease subunit
MSVTSTLLAVSVTEPLKLRFFQFGLLAAILAMAAGAAVGFPVVMKREAYFGQGVGQAMIAGVAVGAFLDLPAAPSAFLGAAVAAVLITLLGRRRLVGSDTAIAVVASTAFALGVAVISSDRERGINVSNVLFGNVLGVTGGDVLTLLVATVVAWLFTWWAGRRLALSAAVPQVAAAHGVPVARLEFLRTLVLALVTATTVQVVGVTLVVVALVFPAATASLLARTLASTQVTALLTGVLTGAVGMYISYWTDIASGPAIVLTAAGALILAVPSSAILAGRKWAVTSR